MDQPARENINVDFLIPRFDFPDDPPTDSPADFREKEATFVETRKRIEALVYTHAAPLSVEAYVTPEPVSYDGRTQGRHMTLAPGDRWGDLFDCAWFHFTGSVPASAAGKRCVLLIDMSGEGLVVDRGGRPLKGLTSVTTTDEFPLGLWGKRTVELSLVHPGREDELARGGEEIDLWVDAGCNDLQGQYRNDGRLKEAAVAVVDTLARDLFYDFTVCLSLYVGLCENNDRYSWEVGAVMAAAAARLDAGMDEAAMNEARRTLAALLEAPNDEAEQCWYTSVGHSHLDLIFLWPVRETIRKGARTCATVLHLMDKYPSYRFGMSQAPLYEWLREQYPTIYDGIRRRIEEGRWECLGAFWIECDTNLPSGESLVRQLLYGKRYFAETFGKEMRIGFLPDVFGYSAALPQFLVRSDVPYFVTQKMNYNDTNRFPRHTFLWRGIDGSEVLTHMLPEDSYNSAAVPQMAIYGKHRNRDLDKTPEALQLFGIGDGGGGPGYEHLERMKRQENMKGSPPLRPGTADGFFARADERRDTYRRWQGEFYLERHQGTYTSIARAKTYNRRCETALHNAEWLSVLAELRAGRPYPKAELEAVWKEVLLYQFHDALPGSSIRRAYDEMFARYDLLLEQLESIASDAAEALTGGAAAVFNPSSWPRDGLASTALGPCRMAVPAFGYRTATVGAATSDDSDGADAAVCADGTSVLENALVRAEFAADGTLAAFTDRRTGRQWLRAPGNRLCLYDDEYNHWDINKGYLDAVPEQAALRSAEPFFENGAHGLRFSYGIGQSDIRQAVSLRGAALVFDTEVDWRETYRMLRAAFPVDVVTDHARCGIQFGYVDRPTHRNTSWDEAKFEICAQQWMSLADEGEGVALLSDFKYGYKAWDNILDINLLRSQMSPCEDGDRGTHAFSYALYPYSGGVAEGDVVRAGAEMVLPSPAYGRGEAAQAAEDWLVDAGASSIVADGIKAAEDGDGYILRLYESGGRRAKTTVCLNGLRFDAVVNLMERRIEATASAESALEVELGAFEIRSYRVRPV